MILTEKAKLKFEKWLLTSDIRDRLNLSVGKSITGFVYSLPQPCLNAIIIEWLDSEGVCIDCPPLKDFVPLGFGCMVNDKIIHSESKNRTFSNRQEATTEAIKKANQIMNEL
jgi:hypothetical protein